MTRWATIDTVKLQKAIDERVAVMTTMLGGRAKVSGIDNCLAFVRLDAERNALITVLECLSTGEPDHD